MNYRKLGKTELTVSEIGLGSESFVGQTEDFALKLFDTAINNGVNYFDLYNPEPYVHSNLGKAIRDRREKFIIQGHLCSAYD